MEKDKLQKLEKLVELSEQFLEQSRQANGYFAIIKQYIENGEKYHKEMNVSTAFYHYSYNGLVVAALMELAKIYDRNKDSINIEKLMLEARKTILLFDDTDFDDETEKYEMYDYFYKVLSNKEELFHSVLPDEIDFFYNEKVEQSMFMERFPTVLMTIEKYFDFYEWKYQKLEPMINNLLKQRNKVYAHNDKKAIKSIDEIILKYPLNHSDIEILISFSLELCRFILALVTGINKAKGPNNIGDWEHTLSLVRLGEKYSEIELERKLKEIKDDFTE